MLKIFVYICIGIVDDVKTDKLACIYVYVSFIYIYIYMYLYVYIYLYICI
jgi:hypothetical protein